ncbi:MAG: hypothetical protein JO256_00390 [Alphaproteobacteria bacterium]|nr:hypothetical protein [Alphaproteobacteria bacterium]
MDDNVINLFSEAQVAKNRRRLADKRAEEDRQSDIDHARLRQFEHAGSERKGLVFKKRSDRVAAAEVIDQLVREGRARHGITVEAIKRWLEERKLSPRVHRYMLSSLRGLPSRQRDDKLMQKARGYLKIAEAIASLHPQSDQRLIDAFKIRVVKPTTLWTTQTPMESDPRAEGLAAQFIAMGAAMAKRERLADLFDKARRVPGQWSLNTEQFDESARTCLSSGRLSGRFEHWTEIPAVPSVPLVRRVHSYFLGSFRIERQGRERPLGGPEAHSSKFKGKNVGGWLELSQEIRFCLAPGSADTGIESLFESRAHVRAFLGDKEAQPHQLLPNWTLKPLDDATRFMPQSVFQVRIDNAWHRMALDEGVDGFEANVLGKNSDPIDWKTISSDPANSEVEHWYFSWAPIQPKYISEWLDKPVGDRLVSYVGPLYSGPSKEGWYALPSIASEVERSLDEIKKAMRGEILKIRGALNEREKGWITNREAEHLRRLAQWTEEQSTDPATSD